MLTRLARPVDHRGIHEQRQYAIACVWRQLAQNIRGITDTPHAQRSLRGWKTPALHSSTHELPLFRGDDSICSDDGFEQL